MSAVDSPPGLEFAGLPLNEFSSKKSSKVMAWVSMVIVCVLSALTIRWVFRYGSIHSGSLMMSGPLFCVLLAFFCVAVRSARIRVTDTKVAWVLGPFDLGIPLTRIKNVSVFNNAVAITPSRGGAWFLSAKDWGPVSALESAFHRAQIPFQRERRNAPLLSKLQSYGRALDIIVILNIVASLVLVILALKQ